MQGTTVKTILELFEEQATRQPSATAVVFRRQTITYGKLQGMANQIAYGLRAAGVISESLVALYLERAPALISSLLGTWKSGGAYLPIDPATPRQRVAFILEDSQAAYVLTQRSLVASLPPTAAKVVCIEDLWSAGEEAASLPPAEIAADGLAYVIYTSGTTGVPKGAEICHRGLSNVVGATARDLALQPKDIVLATATIAFDISNLEIYVPLVTGATIHLVEPQLASDGRKMVETIGASGATVALGTPTFWRLLLEAGWQGSPDLQIITGGEVLPLSLGKRLAEITRAVWNQYGPTETSICATRERILPDAELITLGTAIEDVHFYVLNEQLQQAAITETGEIYIGGVGVGRGYLRRPELTGNAFRPDIFDPRPGAMMYKTGDLGRRLFDGRLDFQGRIDNQIKLRGFRIELEEIEAAMLECSGVHNACVQLVEYGPDDQRLVAYFLGNDLVTAVELREFLRQRLPSYMVPSEFIPLESVPMTINGKIDRKALDSVRIQFEAREAATTPEPTGDSLEAKVRTLWQKFLKVRAVEPSDDFFELGGHSLLAAKMFAEIEKLVGQKVPISVLIENPTLGQFVAYIQEPPRGDWPGLVPIHVRPGLPVIFIAHGLGSNLLLFRALAEELSATHSVYGIQFAAPPHAALHELSLEAFAARYVDAIRQLDPVGPYNLAGHSLGGLLAFEIGSQLHAAGKEIGLLALIDARFRGAQGPEDLPQKQPVALKETIVHWRKKLLRLFAGGVVNMATRKLLYNKLMFKVWALRKTHRGKSYHPRIFGLDAYIALFAGKYQPRPLDGDAAVFCAEDELSAGPSGLGWSSLVKGRLDVQGIPGSHQTMLAPPNVSVLAQEFRKRLSRVAMVS
jgi:amino acid adenylation domain-containing protein